MLRDLLSLPEWHIACQRYRYNITDFAVEALDMTSEAGEAVTPQQDLLFKSVVIPSSRTSVSSGHGTGKSRSAAVVALWHLLFYPESIMMFTAPQIDQLRKVVWKEIAICIGRLRNNKVWGWLADYIQVFSEKVYIKNYEQTWFVFAKTAPKSQPTNLAGQHGTFYMVWIDEACGVNDAALEVALGALTHINNRAVMTSQPASNTGLFYKSHHALSAAVGGLWNSFTFNSEASPLVSAKKLVEALFQYGSRSSAGYMIRILGLFPELKGLYTTTRTDIDRAFKKTKPCISDDDEYGYIITCDVGGGRGKDDSVVTVCRVIDKEIKIKSVIKGEDIFSSNKVRFIHVVDIPLMDATSGKDAVRAKIREMAQIYPNATIVVDPIGVGNGLCEDLTSEGVFFYEVKWGGTCFSRFLQKYYFNKRSHAYVSLSRSIEIGALTFSDKIRGDSVIKNKIIEQAIKIPYTFDDKGRWKIAPKKEMKRMGITSPDVVDTLAFNMMEGIPYTPAYGDFVNFGDGSNIDDSDKKAKADGYADALMDLI